VTAEERDGGPVRQPRPATVLLVDDEEDLRTLIRIGLQRSGDFEVVAEAANGRAAIDLAAEHQPDVVLLDLMMPGLDGREALPKIVSTSPSSMVVVLSALQARQEAAPSLAAGAFAYVEKTELGADMAGQLTSLLLEFRRALRGETVVAPSSKVHISATITGSSAAVAITDADIDDDGH
jgi:DNA-binding NarL/FixJ family response regulator